MPCVVLPPDSNAAAPSPLLKVFERSGVMPGAVPPPSCTPTAPAAAARMMPSLACFHRPASRFQPSMASWKLPTTAKPNAVSRAGMWSIRLNRRCDSAIRFSLMGVSSDLLRNAQ